jgi:hypothetical protein
MIFAISISPEDYEKIKELAIRRWGGPAVKAYLEWVIHQEAILGIYGESACVDRRWEVKKADEQSTTAPNPEA